jgi:DNA-binding HxlR family transcriptional regulator
MARGIDRVGDSWTVLILREAFYGVTRFDEFQKRLGIAPNILTRRLNSLVQDGLLARRSYSERPPRSEYVLTEQGRDFRPVLLMLLAWGNRHLAPEGEAVQLVDRKSGRVVRPILVDAATGDPITIEDHYIAPGPAATDALRARLVRAANAQPEFTQSDLAPSLAGTL